jgi:hypothetical protein
MALNAWVLVDALSNWNFFPLLSASWTTLSFVEVLAYISKYCKKMLFV